MHLWSRGVYKEVMGHTLMHSGSFAALKEEAKEEDLSRYSTVCPLEFDQLALVSLVR